MVDNSEEEKREEEPSIEKLKIETSPP